MSATQGTLGFGTLLQMTISSALANIAEVTDISGPGLKMDSVEMTHMESPASSTDAWREFIGGLADAGEVKLELNFLPGNATHTAVRGAVGNRVPTVFKIIWPNAGANNWTFSALVTGFEPKAPVDNKLSASVTFKVTGKPTFA